MVRDFGTYDKSGRASARRLLTLPTSVALHTVVLGLLVIAPVLRTDDLPEPIQPTAPLALRAMLLPPPPPAPAAPVRTPSAEVRKPRPRPTPVPETKKLVAPVEVQPLASLEPDLPAGLDALEGVIGGSLHGVEGGVIGGVEGGVPGGVEGGMPGGVVGGVIGGLPEAPPAVMEPVRVGGQIQPPRKLRHVAPEYPDLALSSRVQAVVILEATIGRAGQVNEVHVLRGHPLLDEAALEAVRQWAYVPTLLNGIPVPVVMTVTVNFRLS
jgi:periplasmic protein TonB